MIFLQGLLILLLSTSICFAQSTPSVAQLREWITQARSPYTPLKDKEFVAQSILTNFRQGLARDFKIDDPETFYKKVLSDPDKLRSLIKDEGKYSELFTNFSSLISQITVEKQLASCEDYQQMKEGMVEGSSSFDPCLEGSFSHSYTVWESKKPGELKGTEYSIPNFLYSENLQDILDVSNSYHSKYGAANNPPLLANVESIQKANPEMKQQELINSYGMMKLQDDAYQRAMLNAARNALSIELQYNSKGWSEEITLNRATSTIESICKHCNSQTKENLRGKLFHLINNDVKSKKIAPKDPTEVAQGLCDQLMQDSYPFSENLGSKDLLVSNFVAGSGRAKMNGAHNRRVEVLSKIARNGGDGLLFLTESLTDLDEKEPARSKLNCRTNDMGSNADLIIKAGQEATKNALEYAQKINEDFKVTKNMSDVRGNLKTLFRTNPRAVGEALNSNPKLGTFACGLIADIKVTDKNEEFNDKLIIWGAAVAGGALTLTGVLAPAGAALTMGAIALGSAAVGISTGVYEYVNAQESLEKSELYESAIFATGNTRLMTITHDEYADYQSAKIRAMVNFGFSGVDILASVKNLVRGGKSIKEASEIIANGKVDVTNSSKALDLVDAPLAPAPVVRSKISQIDGNELVHMNRYLEEMGKKPRWQGFVEKIKTIRNREAPKLNKRRVSSIDKLEEAKLTDPDALRRFPDYGYNRIKENGLTTPVKSVEEAFEKFNPGQDYDLLDDGVKVIVTPKNKVSGVEYVEIRYDVSGNYFRLQKGKFNGKKMEYIDKNHQMYTDWEGKMINTTGMDMNSEAFIKKMEQTHWNASP